VSNDTPDISGPGGRAETAVRMRAITAGLQAGGLDARLHDTQGVLHITATLCNGGGKGTDVTADEDGYIQISYWNDPGAAPAQIIDVIRRVLAAITGPV
jgi:hypothetical protein